MTDDFDDFPNHTNVAPTRLTLPAAELINNPMLDSALKAVATDSSLDKVNRGRARDALKRIFAVRTAYGKLAIQDLVTE